MFIASTAQLFICRRVASGSNDIADGDAQISLEMALAARAGVLVRRAAPEAETRSHLAFDEVAAS